MDDGTLLGLAIWAIAVGVVYLIYQSKHRDPKEGIILGLLLGVIAIPIALLLKAKTVDKEGRT